MLDIDRRTLAALSAALEHADREGRLEPLVERLAALDDLGPNARSVIFDRDGDIDFVVFQRDGIAWSPIVHGCLVTRVARRAGSTRVAAA